MKDQSKKVASLKHKEQVEKSKNARLMEEARKREDNLSENSQQVKVSRAFHVKSCSPAREAFIELVAPALKDTLRQKAERIEELEEALRESVQINAEREMVLAQEEAARSHQEKQVSGGSPLQPTHARFPVCFLTAGMLHLLFHLPPHRLCLFFLFVFFRSSSLCSSFSLVFSLLHNRLSEALTQTHAPVHPRPLTVVKGTSLRARPPSAVSDTLAARRPTTQPCHSEAAGTFRVFFCCWIVLKCQRFHSQSRFPAAVNSRQQVLNKRTVTGGLRGEPR